MTLQKWETYVKIISVFVLGFLTGISWNNSTNHPESVNKDSITKDSIIRDSIFIIIDSTKTEIKYIEEKYNEEASTIMSNSDSANMEFFTRYLENYKRSIEVN